MDFFARISNKYIHTSRSRPPGNVGNDRRNFSGLYTNFGEKKPVVEYVESLLLYQIRVQSTWPLRIEINYIVIVLRSHKR